MTSYCGGSAVSMWLQSRDVVLVPRLVSGGGQRIDQTASDHEVKARRSFVELLALAGDSRPCPTGGGAASSSWIPNAGAS